MDEKQKVGEIIQVLGRYLPLFPECKLTKDSLLMYAEMLLDYPIEQIAAGMKKAVRQTEFFPKLVHIINAIDELKAHVETGGKGIPDAGEAFEEMLEQARLHSVFTDKWKFSTPEIEKSVQRFGKMEILYLPESEIGIARAQFRKIYEEELRRVAERKRNNAVLASGMASIVDKLANNSSKVFVLKEG